MAINLGLYSGSNGTWGTEFSLTNASTTIAAKTDVGMVQAKIDFSAVAFGDRYVVRRYEKVTSGGTQRSEIMATITQACVWSSPAELLGYGWDYSCHREAGSDRTIPWSIRAAT